MKKLSLFLLIAAVAMSSASCGKKEMPKEEISTAVNVTVFKAGENSIENTVSYTGEIKESEYVSISPKVSAKVARINVEEGQKVNAGDVLIELDATDIRLNYNQAQASYQSAKANYDMTANATTKQSETGARQKLDACRLELDAAKTAYEREQELYNNNSNVILAETSYNNAAEAYERAKQLYDNDTALIAAKNSLADAKTNLERTKNLFEMGSVSQNDLDNAKTAVENAQANVDSMVSNNQTNLDSARSAMISAQENLKTVKVNAGASLEAAKNRYDTAVTNYNAAQESLNLTVDVVNKESISTARAQVDSAKAALDIAANNLNNTKITAPVSGYISAKNINLGQMAQAGAEILTLKITDYVEGEINVTESVIPFVEIGTPAVVSVKSAQVSNIAGAVTAVNQTKNPQTGMYTVKVSIPNQDNKLKVGMFASITLTTKSLSGVITVPSECILQEGEDKFVYIAKGDKAEKVSVTVGISDDENTEIISGIKTGDSVIVKGKEYLSEKNNEIKISEE